MFDKLDVMVKDLKEYDSTLSQPNGFALKEGEEFAYNFNVGQIKSIEAKLLKVKQDVETLEENKTSFHTRREGASLLLSPIRPLPTCHYQCDVT